MNKHIGSSFYDFIKEARINIKKVKKELENVENRGVEVWAFVDEEDENKVQVELWEEYTILGEISSTKGNYLNEIKDLIKEKLTGLDEETIITVYTDVYTNGETTSREWFLREVDNIH